MSDAQSSMPASKFSSWTYLHIFKDIIELQSPLISILYNQVWTKIVEINGNLVQAYLKKRQTILGCGPTLGNTGHTIWSIYVTCYLMKPSKRYTFVIIWSTISIYNKM